MTNLATTFQIADLANGGTPNPEKMNKQKITIKHEGNEWVMRVDCAEYFRFGTKAAVVHAAAVYRRDHA